MQDIVEKTFIYNEHKVFYKMRHGKYDCMNLLVIFSGFDIDYDLVKIFEHSNLYLLWIKDDIFGNNGYYTFNNGNIEFLYAVNELIQHIIYEQKLKDCALVGGSKGGSAALILGLKFNYKTIISIVPQTRIAKFIIEYHSRLKKCMFGTDDSDHIEKNFGDFIDEIIDQDIFEDKNVYLITSKNDVQYQEHIAPYIRRLEKYNNFNVICTESDFVFRHHDVIWYNKNILLSIIYAFENDIHISYGTVTNGKKNDPVYVQERNIIINKKENNFIGQLYKSICKDNKYYPEGFGVIQYIPLENIGDHAYYLVFQDFASQKKIDVKLGIIKNLYFQRHIKDRYMCDYSYGAFASIKNDGIILDNLPDGNYYLNLKMLYKKDIFETHLKPTFETTLVYICNNFEIRIIPFENKVIFIKNTFKLESYDKNNIFTVRNSYIKDNRIYIDGIFSNKYIPTANHRDVYYYAVFVQNGSILKISKLGSSEKERQAIQSLYSNPFFHFRGSYATLRYKGIDICDLAEGVYDVYIYMSSGYFISCNYAITFNHK